MLDIFLVNEDTAGAKDLALKLSGPHKPGEIILLTSTQMDCLQNGGVERITMVTEKPGNLQIVEFDPDKHYFAIAKKGMVDLEIIRHLNQNCRCHIAVIQTQ
jgi:hypothetical protein